jgi:Na+/phosphate symporter
MNSRTAPYDDFDEPSFRIQVGVKEVGSVRGQFASELPQFREGILVMIDRLVQLTRLLRKYLTNPSELQLNEGLGLAQEVHGLEKDLTGCVVKSDLTPDVRKRLIRFPYRLKRIGDMLESILNCLRIKTEDGIRFTKEAHSEINRLFSILLHMLLNTQTVFGKPTDETLEQILSEGKRLDRRLLEFRLEHWNRVELGVSHFSASSLYLDILDSVASTKEYLEKISRTLLQLQRDAAAAQSIQNEKGRSEIA